MLFDIQPLDREVAPAALRQAREIVAEGGLGIETFDPHLRHAPFDGGFGRRREQDGAIRLAAEGCLDRKMVVHQEMPGQIDHGQPVGPPDAGCLIDRSEPRAA
nr:hypothetical protein [Mesorhizobium sp. dw_380]